MNHHLAKAPRDTKFCQLVSFITRPVGRSCLDHIWSNKPKHIVNISLPEICISDHLPVLSVRLYKHFPDKNNPKSDELSKFKTFRSKGITENLIKPRGTRLLFSTTLKMLFIAGTCFLMKL